MDLVPGYRELAPPAELRELLACLWVRSGSGGSDVGMPPAYRVLPDACTDLVWRSGSGAFVAGPDTGPVLVPASGTDVFVGMRFLPGAGGSALGCR